MILTSVKKLGIVKNCRDNPLLMFDEESQRSIATTTIKQITMNPNAFYLNISSPERMNFIFDTMAIGFKLPLLMDSDYKRVEQCLTIYQGWLRKNKMPSELKKNDDTIYLMLSHVSLLFNKINATNTILQRYIPLCSQSLQIFEQGIHVLIKTKQIKELRNVICLLIGMLNDLIDVMIPNPQQLSKKIISGVFVLLCESLIMVKTEGDEWAIFKQELISFIQIDDIFKLWESYVLKLQQSVISALYSNQDSVVQISLISYSKEKFYELPLSHLKKVWIEMFESINCFNLGNNKLLYQLCQVYSKLMNDMNELSLKLSKQLPRVETLYKLFINKIIHITISHKQQKDISLLAIPLISDFMKECSKQRCSKEIIIAEVLYCLKLFLESSEFDILFSALSHYIDLFKHHHHYLLTLFRPTLIVIQKVITLNKPELKQIVLSLVNELSFYYALVCHSKHFEKDFINKTYCSIFNILIFDISLNPNNYSLLLLSIEHFIVESSMNEKVKLNQKLEIEQSTIPINCFELIWKLFIVLKYGLINKFLTTNNEASLLSIIRIFRYSNFFIPEIPNKRCFVVGVINLFCELMPKILILPNSTVLNNAIHLVILYSTSITSLRDKLFFKVNEMFITLSGVKSSFYAPTFDRHYSFFISYFFQTITHTDIKFFDSYIKQHNSDPYQTTVSIKKNDAIYGIYENNKKSKVSLCVFGVNRYNKNSYKLTLLNTHVRITVFPITKQYVVHCFENKEPETEMTLTFAKQFQIDIPISIQPNEKTNETLFLPNPNPPQYSLSKLCAQTLFNSSKFIENSIEELSISTQPLTLYVTPTIPLFESLQLKKILQLYSSKQIDLIKFPDKKLDVAVKTNEHVFGDIILETKKINELLFSFKVDSSNALFAHVLSIPYFILNYLFESILNQDYSKLVMDVNVINSTLYSLKTKCSCQDGLLSPSYLNISDLTKSDSSIKGLINDEDMDWWGVLDQNLVMRRKGSSPLNITIRAHARNRSRSSPIVDN